jgi:hypothetical protein
MSTYTSSNKESFWLFQLKRLIFPLVFLQEISTMQWSHDDKLGQKIVPDEPITAQKFIGSLLLLPLLPLQILGLNIDTLQPYTMYYLLSRMFWSTVQQPLLLLPDLMIYLIFEPLYNLQINITNMILCHVIVVIAIALYIITIMVPIFITIIIQILAMKILSTNDNIYYPPLRFLTPWYFLPADD